MQGVRRNRTPLIPPMKMVAVAPPPPSPRWWRRRPAQWSVDRRDSPVSTSCQGTAGMDQHAQIFMEWILTWKSLRYMKCISRERVMVVIHRMRKRSSRCALIGKLALWQQNYMKSNQSGFWTANISGIWSVIWLKCMGNG